MKLIGYTAIAEAQLSNEISVFYTTSTLELQINTFFFTKQNKKYMYYCIDAIDIFICEIWTI